MNRVLTIKDIAKEAGCSTSTVSRALSNRSDISAETKERIKSIVEKYNFVPNSNAKQLKQNATNTITIIVKGINNMLFAGIIERMQVQMERTKYTVVVDYLDEEEDEVQNAVQLCKEMKPIGIIFLGAGDENLKNGYEKISIPSVIVTNSAKDLGFENISSVFTDDNAGVSAAINHIIEHGHTSIGIIGGDVKKSFTSRLRYESCMKCFQEKGISFVEEIQYEKSRYSFLSSLNATKRLLKKMPEVTALFCMSDVMAIGAIRALRDEGLTVPDDISIVGYDGIELAEYYNPKITTIRQMQEKLAVRGVQILIDSIKSGTAVHEVIQHELLLGESVRYNRLP